MKVPADRSGPKPVPNGSTAPNRSKSPVPDDGVGDTAQHERPGLSLSQATIGLATEQAARSAPKCRCRRRNPSPGRIPRSSHDPGYSAPRTPRRLPDWLPLSMPQSLSCVNAVRSRRANDAAELVPLNADVDDAVQSSRSTAQTRRRTRRRALRVRLGFFSFRALLASVEILWARRPWTASRTSNYFPAGS